MIHVIKVLFLLSVYCLVIVSSDELPVIDISSIVNKRNDDVFSQIQLIEDITTKITYACRTSGFFYITGHGVPTALIQNLSSLSHAFFALSQEDKDKVSMIYGGKAWRGYFRLGNEVTSGIPDQKEGYYFGTELHWNESSLPLHGPNLWPDGLIGHHMKDVVVEYMLQMKRLGKILMQCILIGLDITDSYLLRERFENPTELFRIFRYPPHNNNFSTESMGVGEHTDYGFLTILWQELVDVGGLQVKSSNGSWIEAPAIQDAFIVNLGDALEHNTGGLLRATPHRVIQRLSSVQDRLSFPYFFDPSFDSPMLSLVPYFSQELQLQMENQKNLNHISRWDGKSPISYDGTYGQYLINKVSKAFPDLAREFRIKNDDVDEL